MVAATEVPRGAAMTVVMVHQEMTEAEQVWTAQAEMAHMGAAQAREPTSASGALELTEPPHQV